VFNGIAFTPRIRQKRILPQSFVCNSATAGLLPRKFLLKEEDVLASFRQQRTCQSACWAASDNRDRVLRIHVVVKDLCIGERLASGEQNFAAVLASSLQGGIS
jgi:hypothetical protein